MTGYDQVVSVLEGPYMGIAYCLTQKQTGQTYRNLSGDRYEANKIYAHYYCH